MAVMAGSSKDRMSDAYTAIPAELTSPWNERGKFAFDEDLLLRLITVQDDGGDSKANTGALALAVDIWIATELRRAAIASDIIWPRPTRPRALSQSLSSATVRFKYARKASTREVQEATISMLGELAGSSSTKILGGFFAKEIDVVIAEYDRGLELGVSTKTMTKSFGKNITNRFEEASGDLLNIRRRFPLATFGYVFLVTSNVLREPNCWERIKDMCHKLESLTPGDQRGSYDATCLLLLERGPKGPRLLQEEVPDELHPNVFLGKMVFELFSRSPVSEHVAARELWEASRAPVS
jgi:hypothetical protein